MLSSFRFGDDDRLTQFGELRPGRTDRLIASLGARLGYSGFPAKGDSGDPTFSAIEPSVRFAPSSPVVPSLATAAGQAAGVDTEAGEVPVVIEFLGSARSVRTVPAIDVLSGRAPAGALRDNVVFVGMSDPRGGDGRRLTPAGKMPGVEVHANAYVTLVRGRHPARDILIVALLALIPVAVARSRPAVAGAVILGAAVAYAIVAQLLFAAGWNVPVALPLGRWCSRAPAWSRSASDLPVRRPAAGGLRGRRAVAPRRRRHRPPFAIGSSGPGREGERWRRRGSASRAACSRPC